MAPVVESYTSGADTTSGGTVAAFDATHPTGLATGDTAVVIAHAVLYNPGGSVTWTAPTGFSEVLADFSDTSGSYHVTIFAKDITDATAEASVTWTFTPADGTPQEFGWAYTALRISGTSVANLAAAGTDQSTNTSSHPAPAITISTDGTQIIAGAAGSRDSTWTPPTGLTEIVDIQTTGGIGSFSEGSLTTATKDALVNIADSPVSPGTFTSTAARKGVSYSIAVAPAATGTAWSRTVSDTVGASDASTPTQTASRPVADTVGASDASTPTQAASRPVADALGLTDAFTRTVTYARAVADALGGTDAATPTISGGTITRTLSDVLGLSDTATRTASSARSQADTISATDTSATTVAAVRGLADVLGLTDATGRGVSKALTDTLGALDQATRTAAMLRALDDHEGLLDTVLRTLTAVRTVADVLGATDLATAVDEVLSAGNFRASLVPSVYDAAFADPVHHGGLDVAFEVIFADPVHLAGPTTVHRAEELSL